MKITTIDKLAYLMKQAKEKGLPQPIVFLGAGASKTGGIPLAGEIAEDILEKYKDNPDIKYLKEESRTYSKLMQCLTPYERNMLLKGYIERAKINVTHIYLAQLLIEGFVDYVLTVNFDNLMLRALALFNNFPATYDMAILKDLTTTGFKEKSVVYLHGQHHGLWLLNTDEEMKKVNEVIPPILNSIKNQRPWIFIGYSGEDPIFKHITNLGRFDNELFWISYLKIKPSESVCSKLLNKPLTNTNVIEGYDSDSFMLKLNLELGLSQPMILDKPFTSLKNSLENIIDIDDKEHFKGVKERLELSQKNVNMAIQLFEMGIIDSDKKLKEEIETGLVKKQIIDQIIKNEFNLEEIKLLDEKVNHIDKQELNNLMAILYTNWGIAISGFANFHKDEDLLKLSFEKFQKATELNPKDDYAFYCWGFAITSLARLNNNEELYDQSFKKYQRSIELNPNNDLCLSDWGVAISLLARYRNSEELYEESFEKYNKAIIINPNVPYTYNNWGLAISFLAKLKNDESLYKLSFEKFKKAAELNPRDISILLNWGAAISDLANLTKDESVYNNCFDIYMRAITLNPYDFTIFHNWGTSLFELAKLKKDDNLYAFSFEKFEKSIELNPDNDFSFYSWGNAIFELSKLKSDEKLYEQSIEKLIRAKELGGNVYYLACAYNWKNNKLKAFENLELSLKRNEINPKSVAEDEEWKKYSNDPDFISILNKYK